MTNEEFERELISGIESGTFVAMLENGEMKFYYIEHTTDEMLEDALPVADVKRLLASREAE